MSRPTCLTTECRRDPVGIDVPRPRLSWVPPARQSAYEIDAPGLWQSGRVESGESLGIAWGGPPLPTGARVAWRVRIWDAEGRASDWSNTATWVQGVMDADDWANARWIGAPPEMFDDFDWANARWMGRHGAHDRMHDGQVECNFSHALDLPGVPPKAMAWLLGSGGKTDLLVNGVRILGDPGPSCNARYDRRHPDVRDIAPYLRPGRNTLQIRVRMPPDAEQPPAVLFALVEDWGAPALAASGADWEGAGLDLGPADSPPFGLPAPIARRERSAPAFEKAFDVRPGLQRATLFITGLGFYEAFLGGRRVGNKVLDPAPTAYDKTVLYSTYVVERMLRPGRNALRVLLGHGWFDVAADVTWQFHRAPWRGAPRLLARLVLEYADGSRDDVVSDASWREIPSPVSCDSMRESETIGAPMPGDADLRARTVHAAVVPAPAGRLAAATLPGAVRGRPIAPVSLERLGPRSFLASFPANLAGHVRARFRGLRAGDVVAVRYDERLDVDPFTDKIRALEPWRYDEMPWCFPRIINGAYFGGRGAEVLPGADFALDRFVARGGRATETYEPRFTYNGFRYARLDGLRHAPRPGDIAAIPVQTDFPAISTLRTSDSTLNALLAAADRSYRSNFTDGFPTDCPHREKNGWTCDGAMASEFAQYAYENTAAYAKWCGDLIDSQNPDGSIPGIVPSSGWGYDWGNGADWDHTLTIVPWHLWAYRGDRRTLERIYPAVRRYVAYAESRLTPEGLADFGLGDWCPVSTEPDRALCCTCYHRQTLVLAARMASLLGRPADAARFRKRAEAARSAFHRAFHRGGGVYGDPEKGPQTSQAMALEFGMVPPERLADARAALVAAVRRAGNRFDGGLHGGKHVFRALSRAGHTALALDMLLATGPDTFTRMLATGDGTLHESLGDIHNSRNHVMFGDFVCWAWQFLAGIRLDAADEATPEVAAIDPVAPAFRRVVVAPVPVARLSHVDASIRTPYGRLAAAWTRGEDGRVRYRVRVPPAIDATLCLPDNPDGTPPPAPRGWRPIGRGNRFGTPTTEFARP
ncbi:MAG: family 78 glycoside hydrolase catalytic domain [Kiritimatiellia bacterium]|jgi:alpha-L-rhamnosidase